MALAASMGEPPPMAIIQSGSNSRMASAPFMTVSMDGSDSTPSNSLTSKPPSLRSASTSCRNPPRRIELPPETMMAFLPLRFFTSWRAPSPKYRSRGLVKRPILCLPKQAPLRLAYITEHPIGSVRTILCVAGDSDAMSKRLNAQTNTILPFWLVSYSPKANNDETFFLSLKTLVGHSYSQAGQTFYQG